MLSLTFIEGRHWCFGSHEGESDLPLLAEPSSEEGAWDAQVTGGSRILRGRGSLGEIRPT